MQSLNAFATAEDGAVTVNWIVLTAGLVGLSMAATAVIFHVFEDEATDLQVTIARDDLICADFCDRFADPEPGE